MGYLLPINTIHDPVRNYRLEEKQKIIAIGESQKLKLDKQPFYQVKQYDVYKKGSLNLPLKEPGKGNFYDRYI